jgi:hypothetical protein
LNQDERRALKILREKGVTVDENEFRQWRLDNKKPYLKPQEMADEFLAFQKESRIECPYCGCHILPKYYLDHIAICKRINEPQYKYEFKDSSSF